MPAARSLRCEHRGERKSPGDLSPQGPHLPASMAPVSAVEPSWEERGEDKLTAIYLPGSDHMLDAGP